ncbi:MAG: zinc-dependent metalloprotease [Flavobacteriales bacterium]|nr:zinc-dependent metalloprotease [Flavobacteriales bacterium]
MKTALTLAALSLFVILPNALFSQNNEWCSYIFDGLAEGVQCQTTNPIGFADGCDGTFRVNLVVIRDELGNNSVVDEQGYSTIEDFGAQIIQNLNNEFAFNSLAPYGNPVITEYPNTGIQFSLEQFSYVDDNDFFYSVSAGVYDSETLLNTLLDQFGLCGYINIFVGGKFIETYNNTTGKAIGSADSVPIGCYIFGNASNEVANCLTRVLPHEMGHLFGLWHPWHNTAIFSGPYDSDCDFIMLEPDPNIGFSAQTVNFDNDPDYGLDGAISGDCVIDTYPTPVLNSDDFIQENGECTVIFSGSPCRKHMPMSNFEVYDEAVQYAEFPCYQDIAENQSTNIMGYAPPTCNTSNFTMGQAWRMMCYAQNNQALIRCDVDLDNLVSVTAPTDNCSSDGMIEINIPLCLDATNFNATCSSCDPNEGLTFDGLSIGSYEVQVVSENDCFTESYQIIIPGDQSDLSATIIGETCPGADDGSIAIDGSNIEGDWYDDSGTLLGSGLTLSDVTSGTYYFVGTDESCSYGSFNVPAESQEFPQISIQTIGSCSSESPNGELQVALTHETAFDLDYTIENNDFVLSGLTNSQGVLDIDALDAGSYILTLTNVAGCSASYPFTISGSLNFYISTSPSLCSNSGSITVGIEEESAGSFTVVWPDFVDGGCVSEALECSLFQAEGLSEGTYPIQISTDGGCQVQQEAVVGMGVSINTEVAGNCGTAYGQLCITFPCELPNSLTLTHEETGDVQELNGGEINQEQCFYFLALGTYQIEAELEGIVYVEEVIVPGFYLGVGATVFGNSPGNGCPGGTMLVSPSGSNGPFTVTVINEDNEVIQTCPLLESGMECPVLNISSGDYQLNVTDNIGCAATEVVNFAQYPVEMAIQGPCDFGQNQVSIHLTIPGLSYNLATYTLTFSADCDGCEPTINNPINNGEATIILDVDQIVYANDIQVTIDGCTSTYPIQPYSISDITNGQTCSMNVLNFTITSNYGVEDVVYYTIVNVSGGQNITGTAQTGTPIFQEFYSEMSNFINGQLGMEIQISTNTDGIPDCFPSIFIDPQNYPYESITIEYDIEPICGSAPGSITPTVLGGSGNYSVFLTNLEDGVSSSINNYQPVLVTNSGDYNITVLDNAFNECPVVEAPVTILDYSVTDTQGELNCYSDYLEVIPSPEDNSTIQWSTPQLSEFSGIYAGNGFPGYTVVWTVDGQEVCTLDGSFYISQNLDPIEYEPLSITGVVSIDSPEYWATSITVEDGGELTINSSLYFAADAGIIVKPGGTLVLADGALLTSLCEEMWLGVEVHGPQLPGEVAGVIRTQDGLESATIANAHYGILTAERNNLYTNSSDQSINKFKHLNGQFDIDHVTFINCGVGLYIRSFYTPITNGIAGVQVNGSFEVTQCTFVSGTNGLLDEGYDANSSAPYPNENFIFAEHANSVRRTPVGIKVYRRDGVLIEDNEFENVEVGILQVDCRNDISGGTMRDSRYGIRQIGGAGPRLFFREGNFYPQTMKYTGITFLNINTVVDADATTMTPLNVGLQYLEANTAAIEIVDCRGIDVDGCIFGLSSDPGTFRSENGIILNNAHDFYVHANQFYYTRRAILAQNTSAMEYSNWGLIGARTGQNDQNQFFGCDVAVIADGLNEQLAIRCNLHEDILDVNDYFINYANLGILAQQGQEYDGDPDIPGSSSAGDGSFAALNEFGSFETYHKSITTFEPGYAFRYVNLGGGYPQLLPDECNCNENVGIAPNSGVLHIEDGDETYTEGADDGSCETDRFDLADLVGAEVRSLINEKQLKLVEESASRNTLQQELDNYYFQTEPMLNAIYGGIQDEAELRDFLRDNSPLSNEVLRAYMERYNVPDEYFRDVYEMNSVMDHTLTALLSERIHDMPETIQQEINSLLLSNPEYETVAEIELRMAILQQELGVLKTQYLNSALQLPEAMTDLESNSLMFFHPLLDYYLAIGDYSQANALITTAESDSLISTDLHDLLAFEINLLASGKHFEHLSQPDLDAINALMAYETPSSPLYAASSRLLALNDQPLSSWVPVLKNNPDNRSVDEENNRESKSITMYPNPCRDQIRVEYECENETTVVQFFDSAGKLAYSKVLSKHSKVHILDVSVLSRGEYQVTISQNGNIQCSSQLVKY